MLTILQLKRFALKVKLMWEKGLIRCPVHLPGGNEIELIKIFEEIKYGDYILCSHRNMYHALLSGIPKHKLLKEICQRQEGCNNGFGGSMCVISHDHNFYSSAILSGLCPVAVGIGWAIHRNPEDKRKVWCFVGDGAADEGHFWEAWRYVSGYDLPVTFIIEDNDRATCTDNVTRWGEASIEGVMEGEIEHIKYYKYKAAYPHVGSGVYVQF